MGGMQGYFWNTVLAVNSVIWFGALAFLSYAAGCLLVFFEWQQFILAVAVFTAVSLTELVLTGLAHD